MIKRLIDIVAGCLAPAIFICLAAQPAVASKTTADTGFTVISAPDSDDPTSEYPLLVLCGLDEATETGIPDALAALGVDAFIIHTSENPTQGAIDEFVQSEQIDSSRIYSISPGNAPAAFSPQAGIVINPANHEREAGKTTLLVFTRETGSDLSSAAKISAVIDDTSLSGLLDEIPGLPAVIELGGATSLGIPVPILSYLLNL